MICHSKVPRRESQETTSPPPSSNVIPTPRYPPGATYPVNRPLHKREERNSTILQLFVNVFVFNEKGTKLRGIKCPNDYQSFSCKLEGTQDTCQDKLPHMSWCLSCLLVAEVKLVALQFARPGRNSRLALVCSLTSPGGRPGTRALRQLSQGRSNCGQRPCPGQSELQAHRPL